MANKTAIAPVRVLPEDVVNKIAAGEVVERPASVVKELVENALDAGATRIMVRVVAAGRRTIEVLDNGHGMSEQDAHLAIERHATSKIRTAEDLENIHTMGFRGEALASIAAVSRFELVTRRAKDAAAVRLRVEGGVLRDVSQTAAPEGTRITVNRLYFNTPVRAKFLKGVTTELSQCLDIVQRHALAAVGVAFQFEHNEKLLLDIPEQATLRERAALLWGRSFAKELVDLDAKRDGFHLTGLIGLPSLTRSQRSHQFFFLNNRPIVSRSLQYGFEDGYRELLTIGRRPVGIVMVAIDPSFVDVNIHPSKREVRFRDERAARETIQLLVRERLAQLTETMRAETGLPPRPVAFAQPMERIETQRAEPLAFEDVFTRPEPGPSPVQTEFESPEPDRGSEPGQVAPSPVYRRFGQHDDAPLQVFGTYLLVPDEDRLLIIDQHALHERMTYDSLVAELQDRDYEAQRLVVPILLDVPPSHRQLLEKNLDTFTRLGLEIEPFGGNTYQITAICHLYDAGKASDLVYRVLDALAQGDLFSREDLMASLLRLTIEACRGSVKAGDRLTTEERSGLIEGFRRLRPPYTCPHGRPIVTELTQVQMEKSFRRRQ